MCYFPILTSAVVKCPVTFLQWAIRSEAEWPRNLDFFNLFNHFGGIVKRWNFFTYIFLAWGSVIMYWSPQHCIFINSNLWKTRSVWEKQFSRGWIATENIRYDKSIRGDTALWLHRRFLSLIIYSYNVIFKPFFA